MGFDAPRWDVMAESDDSLRVSMWIRVRADNPEKAVEKAERKCPDGFRVTTAILPVY